MAWHGHCSKQIAATGAQIEVDAIAAPAAETDDRLLGAGGKAIVAFEAVAAGQAALGFVARLAAR